MTSRNFLVKEALKPKALYLSYMKLLLPIGLSHGHGGRRNSVYVGGAHALHIHSSRESCPSDTRKPDVEELTDIIASLQDDMKALWTDETVKALLARKGVRIEDSAGL